MEVSSDDVASPPVAWLRTWFFLISPASRVSADAMYQVTSLGNDDSGNINNRGQVVVSSGYVGRIDEWVYNSRPTDPNAGPLVRARPSIPSGVANNSAFQYQLRSINDQGIVVAQGRDQGPTTFDANNPANNAWDRPLIPGLSPPGANTAPPGQTRALGINNHGDVVGASVLGSTLASHAFIYSNGKTTDLGTLGGTESVALAINDAGQVVGHSNTTILNDAGGGHGFIWQNGVMQDLTPSDPTHQSVASAINASGLVAGQAFYANGQYHATIFNPTSGLAQDLGTLPGGTWSVASAINGKGQVVGVSVSDQGWEHAFLYSNGVMKDLNNLIPPNSTVTLSEARAINDLGQIVVGGNNRSWLLTPSNLPAPTPPPFPEPVPEPSMVAVFGLAFAAIAYKSVRRAKTVSA